MPPCLCGHGKFTFHPWNGTTDGPCGACVKCGKHSDAHVFVSHLFERCKCVEYRAPS